MLFRLKYRLLTHLAYSIFGKDTYAMHIRADNAVLAFFVAVDQETLYGCIPILANAAEMIGKRIPGKIIPFRKPENMEDKGEE